MPDNIFEYAVSNKLRFPYKGSVSVEDLYDLSVNELDSIYKTLNREAKKVNEDSLLVTKSNTDVVLAVKIEIVKFIVNKKLAEADSRKRETANREQKKKILAILADKQNEALKNKSQDELIKMLEDLE